MKKLLLLFAFFLGVITVKGQTTLHAGDVSFIGFNSGDAGYEGFAFVCWVQIDPGTSIRFIQDGFNSGAATLAGNLRHTKGTLTWTTSATITAGTVISIQNDGATPTPHPAASIGSISLIDQSGVATSSFGLSNSGARIFAAQGGTNNTDGANASDTFSGTLLCGIYWQGVGTSAGWVTSGAITSANSYLPPELQAANIPSGIAAGIAFGGNAQRAQYTGPRTGLTLAQYKADVINTANWTPATGSLATPAPVTLNTTVLTIGTPSTAPTLTTAAATSVLSTSATLGGNVSANGGATLTEHGIVYGSAASPTIGGSNTKVVISGTATGDFSQNITSLAASTAYHYQAYATNSVNTSYGGDQSFTTTAAASPTLSSLASQNTLTTNATTVNYKATFAAAVTGLTASNFSLSGTGTSGASIGTPTTTDAGINWNIPVTTGTSGTLLLSFANVTNLSPTVSTATPVAGNNAYSIDKTAPIVASINISGTSPTNASSVDYTVTFSEPVTGVDGSDFTPTTTAGAVAGTVSGVTGSGTTYTVTISSVSGNGGLRLDLNASGTNIFDLAANPVSGGFITGQTYTIDTTPATLTSGSYFSNNGFSSQYAKVGDNVTLSIGYNEVLQSLTMKIDGNAVTVTPSNGNRNWTGVLTTTSADIEGNVPWTLSATDLAGNVRNYANTDFGTVLTFDKTPPAITITPATVSAAPGADAVFTVAYNDANFNFSTLTSANITVNSTGTATANPTIGLTGSGLNYTVTLTGVSGLGTLGISIAAGTAQDIPGNIAIASGPSPTILIAHNNAVLSALTTSSGSLTPAFDGTVLAYTATVPSSSASVKVTPTAVGPGATLQVRVNGGTYATVASGAASADLALNVGDNTIDELVTAEDGIATNLYTITINRAAAPSITSVSVPVNNTYIAGQTLTFIVNTSENVTVTGTPQLPLTIGSSNVNASFSSGSGSSALTFTYTVQAGDLDADGVQLGSVIALNGATIKNSGSVNMVLTLNNVAGTANVKVDAIAPAAPAALAMAPASDSGISGSDGITNVSIPHITGTAEAGSTVILYDTDGTTVLGTAVATGGNWSITTTTLSTGPHTLTAKATDVAGNVSTLSSGLAVVIDQAGPTAFAISNTTVSIDVATSGSTIATLSATDATAIHYGFATGNGTTDADNSKFTISGTSLIAAQSLSAGTYHIYLAATDAAGNDAFQTFTIDVVDLPVVNSIVRAGGASAIVLAATTSVTYTVTFSQAVTGVDAGDFTLSPTGNASGSISGISGSGTTYTITVNALAGDGALRLDLKSSGTGIQNGNSIAIASGYTGGQTYTLDHIAPAAPSALALSAGSDSGTQGDGITNTPAPVITGHTEANATVTLFDTDGTTVLGTTTADGSGNWSITSSTLSAGSHTLKAKATDAAGNTGVLSAGFAVLIDGASPTSIALSTTTISTTAATNGSTIATLSATDATAIHYGLAIGNGTNDADNGKFTISGTSLVTAPTLGAGTYHIYVSATDAAGNTAFQAFTINVVDLPVVNAIIRAGGAAATVPASTTSVTYTVTFSQPVTGVDQNDFTLTRSASASGSISGITGSGTTYTVTVNTLTGDGTLRLDLKTSGTGIQNGNSIAIASGYTGGQTYTFDHTAPAAPGTPVLASGSDSGVSNSDDITNVTTPVMTGTAEAGSTVTLYDTDGTTVLGSAVATGGNWSITTTTLTTGLHTLKAKATDAAGNLSVASLGLNVTIDTTAPTLAITSNVPALKIGETATITFTFTEDPGTTFTWNGSTGDVVVTGGTLSTISGSGLTRMATFTPTANTNNGTASITVAANTYTDVAGNNGGAGTTPSITFDTQAPAAPSAPDLAAASDNGISNNDNLTGITTPTFTGTAETGSTVSLYDSNGTTVLGSTTATGGNWIIASTTLSEGPHTITAKATDAAGNTGAASAGLGVTIDTTAPAVSISAPSATSINSGTAGTVTYTVSYADANLNTTTLTNGNLMLNATGSAAASLALSGSGSPYTVTLSNITGTGTLGISVAAGTATDKAGNSAAANGPSATVAVGPAGQSITFHALPVKTYGDADFAPGATSNNSGIPITYASDNQAVATIVNGKIHIVGAGTARITTSQAGDADHTAAPDVSQTLTVNKEAITVTADAQSKTYGDTDPLLTYQVTTGALVGSDTFSGTLTRSLRQTVGSYPIMQGTLSLDADNYTLSYVGANFVIGQRSLTVSATGISKVYDGTTLATVTLTDNRVSGDTFTTGYTAAFADKNVGNNKTVNVTGIAITDGAAANYTVNSTAITSASITPAALTYTAVTNSAVYGTAIPTLTGTVSGFAGSDDQANATTGTLTFTTTATAASPVGSYAITGSGLTATSGNYVLAQAAANSTALTITPAALTITANNQSRPYGQANPSFTVSYSGFAGTDNAGSLTTAPTITTTATAASLPNTYPITVSGAASPNYSISYTPGTLTVTPLTNANLNNLSISTGAITPGAGTLTPVFATATTAYTVSVGNNITGITITPTTADATATVKVNGATVASGTASGSIPLTVGTNTITTVVTAQDGTTKVTYTVTVTRAPSSNAGLSFIAISDGTLSPVFATGTTAYTASEPYTISSVTFTPTMADATATITVNGTAVSNGSATTVQLNAGDNTITTVVTAQDGTTKITYTVTIHRAAAPDAIFASNILTPNGDGKNDYWIIKDILLYPNNVVTVYDRAGRTVYSKKGYANDWAGTLNGLPLTEDTYYYVVNLDGTHVFTGFVTVLRNRK